jgi:hypothetical protein
MKNDGTYFIVWQGSKVEKYYPQNIEPFKWQGIEFFVHRVIDGVDIDSNTAVKKPLWSTQFYQVSEKSTGRSISLKNITTIVDAKAQAIQGLDKIGIDKVKEVISKVKENTE